MNIFFVTCVKKDHIDQVIKMNTNTLGIMLKQLQYHEMIDFLEALESNKKLKEIIDLNMINHIIKHIEKIMFEQEESYILINKIRKIMDRISIKKFERIYSSKKNTDIQITLHSLDSLRIFQKIFHKIFFEDCKKIYLQNKSNISKDTLNVFSLFRKIYGENSLQNIRLVSCKFNSFESLFKKLKLGINIVDPMIKAESVHILNNIWFYDPDCSHHEYCYLPYFSIHDTILLISAIHNNNFKIIKYLVEKTKIKNINGLYKICTWVDWPPYDYISSPILEAILYDKIEIVTYLMHHGAIIDTNYDKISFNLWYLSEETKGNVKLSEQMAKILSTYGINLRKEDIM